MLQSSVSRCVAAGLAFTAVGVAQIITTVAGTSFAFPSQPLSAANAPLGFISAVAADSKGNVYTVDFSNNLVSRLSSGTLTVVAGNGIQGFSGDGGPATSAALNSPTGVAVDAAGQQCNA